MAKEKRGGKIHSGCTFRGWEQSVRVRVTELGLGLLSSGFSWRWSQPPSFVLFGTVYSYSSQVSFPHPLSRGGCGVAFGGGVSSSSILAA